MCLCLRAWSPLQHMPNDFDHQQRRNDAVDLSRHLSAMEGRQGGELQSLFQFIMYLLKTGLEVCSARIVGARPWIVAR